MTMLSHCSKCGVWIGTKRLSGSHALCRECNLLRSRLNSASYYAKHGKRVRRKKLPGEPRQKSGPKREPITDAERWQARKIGRSLPVHCGDLWSLVDQHRFGSFPFASRGGNKKGSNGRSAKSCTNYHADDPISPQGHFRSLQGESDVLPGQP